VIVFLSESLMIKFRHAAVSSPGFGKKSGNCCEKIAKSPFLPFRDAEKHRSIR